MSEFAFCCDTILIGYFSIIRNTIRRNGSSTVMLIPMSIQFVILHGNLAYIELTIYSQVSTNLRITSCFQSASFDIAGCCDVSSSCVHSIASYFPGYRQTPTCDIARSCIYSIAGYFACRAQSSTNSCISSCLQSASFDIAGCCDVSSSCVHSIASYFPGYRQTPTCDIACSCIYSVTGYFACRR